MDEPQFDGQTFLDTFRNVASSVTAVTTYSESGEPVWADRELFHLRQPGPAAGARLHR